MFENQFNQSFQGSLYEWESQRRVEEQQRAILMQYQQLQAASYNPFGQGIQATIWYSNPDERLIVLLCEE